MKKTPGWQQPAVTPRPAKPICFHWGLVGASLTIGQHRVGHTWVCTCGAEFVVVSGTEGKKFEKRVMR